MSVITTRARIERAHLRIMRDPSFCAWAGLLMLGGWGFDNKQPTAYVDASGHVKYNEEFINAFQPKDGVDVYVNWVILHETAHKALMHLTRGRKLFEQSQELANIAADFVVNSLLHEIDPSEAFAKHPREPDGSMRYLYDAKYKGWSFKEVWNDLINNQNPNFKVKQMDTHSVQGGGDGNGKPMSDEDVKRMEGDIEQALRAGTQMAAKMGGSVSRSMTDMLIPQIDWREQMDEFIMNVCQGDEYATWRRPNRRFIGADMYFPSMQNETCGEVVAAIDTSGSVGQQEMTACISEVVDMCRSVRPEKLRILYWSDGVEHEEIYTPEQYDDVVTTTKPKGGGGTSITPVAKYVNSLENVQCAIILTDGYTSDGWGDWKAPTLWAFTHRNMQAPFGKSLYVDI